MSTHSHSNSPLHSHSHPQSHPLPLTPTLSALKQPPLEQHFHLPLAFLPLHTLPFLPFSYFPSSLAVRPCYQALLFDGPLGQWATSAHDSSADASC